MHHKIVRDLLRQVEIETKAKGIGQANFLRSLKTNLTTILTVPGRQGFVFASKPPTTVLMVGLQGSGKTTTTVKLANYLKLKQKKVLVVACDLQRLAAVEQLRQLCSANEIDLYSEDANVNPVQIAKNAMKKAKEGLYDVVLIDTAGRLAIDAEVSNRFR